MKAFYGSRISENMTVTPEGFLVCHHVPIARTGDQEYLSEELGIDGEGIVKVFRPSDEVFSKATLASFEGKPVSLGHPPRGIDVTNAAAYVKGHVQNVRRGEDSEADLMIAELIVHDQELIRQINEGLREVSCGYDYDLDLDGETPVQRNIRGNHVAVVESGRAGDRVSIRDEKPRTRKFERKEGRKPMDKRKKAGLFSKILGIAANDTSPEEMAAVVEAIEEAVTPDETPTPPAQPAAPDSEATPEAPALQVLDNETATKLIDAMNNLTNMLASSHGQTDQDPLDAILEEIVEGTSDEESVTIEEGAGDEEADPAMDEESEVVGDEELPSTEVEASETPENPIPGADAAAKRMVAAAIKGIKPIIAKMPEKDRRAASDAAAKALRKAYGQGQPKKKGANAYAKMNADRAANARRQMGDKKADDDGRELGRSIMKKHNPHYKDKG